jgi:hypothetical protein
MSWSSIEGMQDFAGTVTFTNEFLLEEFLLNGQYILDCSDANDFVRVCINGVEIGEKFWKPFVYDISRGVKQGVNKVEIQVTNSLACRFNEKKTRSGLMGPVTILLKPYVI